MVSLGAKHPLADLEELDELWDEEPVVGNLPTGDVAGGVGAAAPLPPVSESEVGDADERSDSSSDINFDDVLEEQMDSFRRPNAAGGYGVAQSVPGGGRGRVANYSVHAQQLSAASDEPLSMGMQIPMQMSGSVHMMGASMPRGSISQLGTSAPIAIPAVANRRLAEAESNDKRFAATFVPPHLMETRADVDATGRSTHGGISPSASLKRERLAQRNAILRSTGFIEATTVRSSFVETLDPIKEAGLVGHAPPPAREAGALSKALDAVAEGYGVA